MNPRALRFSVLILALLAAALPCAAAAADPIRIDRSFGHRGISAPQLGPSFESSSFGWVEQRPDGRIVVNGAPVGAYLADGTPDPASPPPASGPRASLPGGDVLVAPYFEYNRGRVERLNGDGSLDTAWGHGGRSDEVPFQISQILPLASGQILVVGTRVYAGGGRRPLLAEAAVARLQPDGSIDPGLGSGWVGLHAAFGVYLAGSPMVASRPGGALAVVVGRGVGDRFGPSQVIGLTATGALDASFGGDGIVELDTPIVVVHGLDGGGLDLVGTRWSDERECCGDFMLTRLDAAGQPAAGFGEGSGVAIADFGGNDVVRTAQWEADGSVVLAGSTTETKPSCGLFVTCRETPALARFTAGGALDPGFGSGGLVRLEAVGAGLTRSREMGVIGLSRRNGGGLLASGGAGPTAFLAALRSDGSPDPAFATGGFALHRVTRIPSVGTSDVVVDRQGRVLVAGLTDSGIASAIPQGAVIRYLPNGALDRSYGGGGYAFAGGSYSPEEPTIAIDRRGRALVGHWNSLARLTPRGEADSSFGRNGAVRLPQGMTVTSVLALKGGKILLTAEDQHKPSRALVARLLADGRRDKTFRGRGIATVPCRPARACSAVKALRDRRGRILLAGFVSRHAHPSWRRPELGIARLAADGSLDRSFGQGGWKVIGRSRHSAAVDIARQGKRILVAGWATGKRRSENVLIRLREDGRLDRGFGRGGIAAFGVRRFGVEAPDRVSLLPAGRRIVVVRSGSGNPVHVYAADGSRRRGFGGGKLAPDRMEETYIPPSPQGALQRGKVVIAWNQVTSSGLGGITTRVALRRLLIR